MSELAEQRATAAQRSRLRAAAAHGVLVVSLLLLLLSAFAVWIDRVALNTDAFTDTSSELIEDPKIREVVAQRAVDELYASVDVEEVVREQAPDSLDRASGLLAAGARQALYQILDRALRQPALQRLWGASIRESHARLVAVLGEEGDVVRTERGVVTLDLRLIVLEAAERVGIRSEVEPRLPADAGQIVVLRSDELDTAQDAFQLLETLAWLLPLITLAAFALVVAVASEKRQALRSIGIGIALVGVLGLVAANVVGNYLVAGLASDTETREASHNAWDIVTEVLRGSFRWLVVLGILVVVATWLAGPGRRAVAVRRVLAPGLRERPWAYAALGFVALVLLSTGALTSFTRFLVLVALVVLGAAWIEAMRRLTMHEFPHATAPVLVGEARVELGRWWDALRARAAAAREARSRPDVSSPPLPAQAVPSPAQAPQPTADLTSRLVALSELHARGELTDDEYAAAKARVLAGE